MAPVAEYHSAWTSAHAWYRWATRFATEWELSDLGPRRLPAATPPPRVRSRVCHESHELWRSQEQVWCRMCGCNALWPTSKPPPSILTRQCKGNMADRCRSRGRETAVSPMARPVDDGRISRAFLQSKAAHQLCDVGGATTEALVSHSGALERMAALVGSDQPPGRCRSLSDEEDPFGHGGLLDEPQPMPRGMGGNAIPRGEARSDESVDDLIVPVSVSIEQDIGHLSGPAVEAPAALFGAHDTHVLTRTAHVVWCRVCGRHAATRLGIGLQRPCVGRATGAYPARIERLRGGRHPIIAELLGNGV